MRFNANCILRNRKKQNLKAPWVLLFSGPCTEVKLSVQSFHFLIIKENKCRHPEFTYHSMFSEQLHFISSPFFGEIRKAFQENGRILIKQLYLYNRWEEWVCLCRHECFRSKVFSRVAWNARTLFLESTPKLRGNFFFFLFHWVLYLLLELLSLFCCYGDMYCVVWKLG